MLDFKFALRQLLRTPGFTTVAVLTLALGIGVNTSMFSGLHAVLMPELPYPDAGRLVRVFRTTPHLQRWPHSPANFLDERAQNSVFTHMAATTSRSVNLSEAGQPAERLRAVLATRDLIPMLGLPPLLGRASLPEEDRPGRSDVALLSHALWLRRLNADPGIVGRTFRLDGETVTVVGVMPPEFSDRQVWGAADLIRPMALGALIRDVLWIVLGKGLRLTALGLVLGCLGPMGLTRTLASVAPGLRASGPAVLISVSALLLAVATQDAAQAVIEPIHELQKMLHDSRSKRTTSHEPLPA